MFLNLKCVGQDLTGCGWSGVAVNGGVCNGAISFGALKKVVYVLIPNIYMYAREKIFVTVKYNRKRFVSADYDTLYTIYLFLCKQTADSNPFRGKHCIYTHLFNRLTLSFTTLAIPNKTYIMKCESTFLVVPL